MGGWFLLPRFCLSALLWVAVSAVLWSTGAGGSSLAAEISNPDGVAVIIGNRDYSRGSRDVGEVEYAHRDAEAFRRYVIDVLGFDPRYVRVLKDAALGDMRSELGTPGHPGRIHSLVERRRLLNEGALVSDVVVFYSGHGMPSLDLEKPGSYLLPVDADPHDPERNGYSVEALYDVVGALPARSVRVFLDACFTGVGGDGMQIVRGSPAAVTRLPEEVGENTVSFTAAKANQIAYWDDDAGHGMFTHHVLDALYGGGDRDGNGAVTVGEVERYLQEHLWHAVLDKNGREQDAVLLDGTGTGNVVLSAAIDGSFPARPDLDAPDRVAVEPKSGDGGGEEDDEIQAAPSPLSQDRAAVTGGEAILTVETTPPGAAVHLGGARVGETPVERYDLRAGTYTVTLDHPTHETVILEDQSLADHRVLRIVRTLALATGSLTVITQPSGSWVEHEGTRLAESTPVTLEGLPSGLLTLTLGAEGHRPERVEVLVPKGGVALVEQVLKEVQYGTLTLELEPTDAQVVFSDDDGLYRAGMRLAEGDHRVRVTREGYSEATLIVTVSGETREHIVLEPAPLPFTIVTRPADAAVRFVEGGEAYRPGIELLPGEYRVQISAEGWETQEASIRHGAVPTRYTVALKRSWDPVADEAALELERSEKRLVQEGLAAEGFDPGQPDGLIGRNTRKALRGWQAKQGHEATSYLTADQAKLLLAAAKEAARRRAEEAERERVAEEAARKREALRPGRVFQDCPECPEMVAVPAGSFIMGSLPRELGRSPTESPQHRVKITAPFAVGKYEVTFAEWDVCVAASGCNGYRPDDNGWGRGRRPVINVSWINANAYARWLSRKTGERYRLLSEAEWEYAARAGTTGPFYFDSTISTNQANYDGNSTYGYGRKGVYRKRTMPVGSFPANSFGLHDMHGNVSEWIKDCWHKNYVGAPSDASTWTKAGECSRRVVRGGSWVSDPAWLRSAARFGRPTTVHYNFQGFRIARMLNP